MRFIPIVISLVCGCTPGSAPPSAPVALTPLEYNHTVRDLLDLPDDGARWPAAPDVVARLAGPQRGPTGVDFVAQDDRPWPWPFPEEPGVDGFDGMAPGQSPSAYQLEQLQAAAEHFAAYALVSPSFFPCEDWSSAADEARRTCAWSAIERFHQRAIRRPATQEETGRLQALWNELSEAHPLDEAVVLTVSGILQAPDFLYQLDPTADATSASQPLSDWAMASRLSYLMWDTLPDEALFRAAERGQLSTPAQLRAQVRRMWEDPRARDAVVRFHTLWLETDQVAYIAPARRAHGPRFGLSADTAQDTTDDGAWPGVLGRLRASYEAETHLFVSKTLFEGPGTFGALLTEHHGYLSDASAPVYGSGVQTLSAPEEQWTAAYVAASGAVEQTLTLRPARLPPTERAGLLTLPSVLAVGAHPVHPSPILRGKRILERVLCRHLPAPPPDAEAAAPPDTVEADATNRARTEAATSPPACASCHAMFQPLGFAFESYDAVGAYRTTDHDQPVQTDGQIPLDGGMLTFTDAIDLTTQLASHPAAQRCYAQRWMDYALGVPVDPSDPEVRAILDRFERDDRVLGLLEAIVSSEMFRRRSTGGAP